MAQWGDALVLTLALPRRFTPDQPAGRFLLARCGAQTPAERDANWDIYLRRPLLAATQPRPLPGSATVELCQVTASLDPTGDPDPGYAWLAGLAGGQPVNVTGWFGGGFPVTPLTRRLLLVAEPGRLWPLLPLLDPLLDRGGQASVVLLPAPHPPDPATHQSGPATQQPPTLAPPAWRSLLPLAVELHLPAPGQAQAALAAAIPWADQLCLAVATPWLTATAGLIRQRRLRLEPGFALALVDADLACGVGACLACVVPLANGSLTRACIHGPVFDLLELTGRA